MCFSVFDAKIFGLLLFFLFIMSLNRENEIINGQYSIANSMSFCLYYFKKEKRNKNRSLEFID